MDSIKVTENKLSGWSNTTYSSSKTYHPTKYEEIVEIFQFALSRNLTVSILGGKRSYSDNFLNTEISLDINKLNKIIELNGNELLVQSGVTFYDIAEFLDGKGLMIEVIPGTGHVSIGGAVSNNIHGKNAFKSGFFGNHILEITYINLSNFKIEKCTREKNSDVFYSIISGLGVLAVVLEVKINLKKVKHLTVSEKQISLDDINSLFKNIDETEEEADYLIASIDLSSSIKKNSFAKLSYSKISNVNSKKKKEFNLFKLLGNHKLIRPLFNFKLTYKIFEQLFGVYSSGLFSSNKEEIKNLFDSHFLNDVFLPEYNYFFKNGFFEYQCNIPKNNGLEFYNFFLNEMKELEIKPLMTGLKSYSEAKENFLLSFQLNEKSYAFTFDFPNVDSNRLKSFFNVLNEKVISLNGKVYYAKTACLNLNEFESMYGKENVDKFKKIKNKLDPNNLLVNNLYKRIFLEEEFLANEY